MSSGTFQGGKVVKVCVGLRNDQMQYITALADSHGITFSAALRKIVQHHVATAKPK